MKEDPPSPRLDLDALLDLAGLTRPEWQRRAACRGRHDLEWFPGRGQTSPEAVALCRACPVADDCLNFALDELQKFGIWGGLAERQRRKIRMTRRRAQMHEQTDPHPGEGPRRPTPSGPRGAGATPEHGPRPTRNQAGSAS